MPDDNGQLELFDLEHKAAPRPQHRPAVGKVHFMLRHDQLVLVGIGALIGLTVVFAFGVERGKQLARVERVNAKTNLSQSVDVVYAEPQTQKQEQLIQVTTVPAESAVVASPEVNSVRANELSGYAIQIVTYTKQEYAERERKRLEDSGELAFVKTYGEHSVLFIGPFESKDVAKRKLSSLKATYSDCFLKSL